MSNRQSCAGTIVCLIALSWHLLAVAEASGGSDEKKNEEIKDVDLNHTDRASSNM